MHLLPRAALLLALPALLLASQVSSPKSRGPDPVAHGTPDYGVTQGQLTTHQVKDLGELAARLGSIVTHDRRGEVIWMDDAESSANKWAATLVGVNSSFATSTARARNSATSFLLRPGDAVNDTATMSHQNPYPVLSRLGLESSFNLTGEARRLTWRVVVRDATNQHDFRVRWDSSLLELQYFDAAGAFVSFATGVGLLFNVTLFHTAKLVVDPTTDRYVRLILDNVTYDMDTLSGQNTLSGAGAALVISLEEETLTAVPTGTYVDDVILTQNEPANP